MSHAIRVSAVVLRDVRGRVLTVRKRGTSRFMLPGGKPEPGETPRQTAVREVAEELSVHVDADQLRDLGCFTAAAANEAGHTVDAVVFETSCRAIARPAAEIAELRWQTIEQTAADLAPLLSEHVLPALRASS